MSLFWRFVAAKGNSSLHNWGADFRNVGILAERTGFGRSEFVSTDAQAVPDAQPRLNLQQHQRIAFVGNSLAERMNLFGQFRNAAAFAVSGPGTRLSQFRLARG